MKLLLIFFVIILSLTLNAQTKTVQSLQWQSLQAPETHKNASYTYTIISAPIRHGDMIS